MSTYNFSNDPFADPVITAATNQNNTGNSGLEDYNPFANQPVRNVNPDPFSPTSNVVITEPPTAVLSPSNSFQKSDPPPSYSQSTANNLTAEQLRQRQEELDRRAAELAAREAELQRAQRLTAVRENNFPPLPSFFPCKPCFYQDINVEIEVDFQQIVRQVYQLWLFYVGTLFVNFIGCLVAMIVGFENGAGMFFFSLVTMFIFTPLSFLFWYRPLYKAFRDDSSFNFMIFFFVFFCQLIMSVFWALGFIGTGSIGLITTIKVLNNGYPVIFRIICFLCTFVLTCFSLASLYILVKVRSVYSHSSASFEKAQAEFTTKVLSNDRVQQMAAGAAQTAARQAMNQAFQTNNGNNANPNANTNTNASGFRY